MPLATLSFSITIYDENAIIPLQYSSEIEHFGGIDMSQFPDKINRRVLAHLRVAQLFTLSVLTPNSEMQTVALYGRIAA